MLGIAEKARTNLYARFAYGLLYMDVPVLANQKDLYQER